MKRGTRGKTSESATRVLIVDDHPVVRRGLAGLLAEGGEFEVCGEAENAADALRAVEELEPAIVIVDLVLKESSGMDLIRTLKAQTPGVRTLVVSMHEEAMYAERALSAGAAGYVMKVEADDELLAALRKVNEGDVYLSEAMVSRLLHRVAGDRVATSPLSKLSDRELEVFELIGRGSSVRQIAERLRLSVKTIDTYRANIKTKLGLETSIELMRYAIQYALERDADKE